MSKAETENTEAYRNDRELREINEVGAAMRRSHSGLASLIRLTDYPTWGIPNGPDIKKGFRLSYQLDQEGNAKPMLSEEADAISPAALQEVDNVYGMKISGRMARKKVAKALRKQS